ncbi:VIR protein [Plasmodium vivax]|uniref:VIR protein n=1 Tax=Plasmodium vivax TaxID=5855 RepID=A0A1G4E659_PLAVI|nr:VIR protein [Plasmodium vivax]
MAQISRKTLEDASSPVKLSKMYEEFFVKDKETELESSCNELKIQGKVDEKSKELCNTLIYFLKKIAGMKDKQEGAKRCSYLPYWLYDEIERLYKYDYLKNVDKIGIVKDVIAAVNKVNDTKIKDNKCTLKYDNKASLDELIKRKISYIYFKKYNDIKSSIKPQNKDECSKYFTYLTNMKSLYDKLKNDHCKPSFWPFSSAVPDYFNCTPSFDPKDLLSKAEACKAKGTGGGGLTLFGLLLGGSPSRTSGTGSASVTKETTRASGSEAKITGSDKNASPDVPLKDKAAKEVTKATVAEDRSKGLTSSISHVTVGSSPRPAAEATVRNSAVAGEVLSSQVANLQPRIPLSPSPGIIPGQNALAAVPTTLQIRDNTENGKMADSSTTLESVSDKLDSKFYRNIIMAVAILGTIFFLFYYNMSSGLKSRFPKRKRKKKIFEHNYYEEYEKELAKYESENESLDSQSDQYYLNYQPEGDYDY